MNRDKQIEEMAKALTSYEYKLCEKLPKDKCLLTSAIHAQVSCDYCKIAEFLVNADYRKASEVAREIFEEIENALDLLRKSVEVGRKNDGIKYQQLHDGRILSIEAIKYFIAELKKKYTESEKDNG